MNAYFHELGLEFVLNDSIASVLVYERIQWNFWFKKGQSCIRRASIKREPAPLYERVTIWEPRPLCERVTEMRENIVAFRTLTRVL